MHARFRSPGNEIRSDSLGMECSIRAPGMYHTEYRNFNRGFGRGSPNKPFPPPQPPRKTDIFMEAGRLAAEYLVSQGLLPPNVLPEKWQNGGLNNQIGDPQDFRTQEKDLQLPSEGRTSVLARLGSVNPDAGLGRKRFPDESNAAGGRSHGRGRKKIGSFRSYSSDWGRENGDAGPQLEKSRSFPDMEGEDDMGSANNIEQQRVAMAVSGGGVSEVISNELPSKSDNAGESESEREKFELPNDIGSKTSSSSTKEELPPVADGEFSKGSDDSKVLNMENVEVKDGMSEDEIDKEGKAEEDFCVQCTLVEGDSMNKSGIDLLQLSGFAKVPTRARSSLSYKGSEVDPVVMTDEEKKSDIAQQEGPKVPIEEDSIQGTSNDALTNQTQSSQCIESDISRPQSVQTKEDIGDLDAAFAAEREKCTAEQSLPSGSFMYEENSGQSPSGLGVCSSPVKERGEKRAIQNDIEREGTEKPREGSSSMVVDADEFGSGSSPVKERGEKRAIQDDVERVGTKKPREWSSYMVVDADEYFNNRNFGAMPSNSYGERLSQDKDMVNTFDQQRVVDVAFFPKGETESGVELKEEKQHFQNSFKICDLNLMEAFDMTEHHDIDPVLDLSTLEAKKVPVDIDLSINNNCTRSNDYSRQTINGKEVIIVNLEDDSSDENKAFDTSDRKTEGVYSGLDSFPNNTGSASDLPDVQDGYGLMISELLETDITNCSSVPADITGLQTDIGLHNEAGILCDDDSIYLSLGEIPLSFQGVWPEKPF